MSARIKPQIYISWLPIGKINLKPLLFASYIPTPYKASADLSRNVSKTESTCADTLNKIFSPEKISADISRTITDFELFRADTKRKIPLEETFSGDIFRQVFQADSVHADSFRQIKNFQRVIADTSRRNGLASIRADLMRYIETSFSFRGDTKRIISTDEKFSSDTFRQLACDETIKADIFRKVENSTPTFARADSLRSIGYKEKFSANTMRMIGYPEKSNADTLIKIALIERAQADFLRAIRELARADSFRKIAGTEKSVASTVIRIPHILNYFLQPSLHKTRLLSDNQVSLINTFKDYGVTAINISLNERTFSDDFRFDIARTVDFNEVIQGKLLDYPFNFLVEETTQTELVTTVKGRYSIDDLLYTWFTLGATFLPSSVGRIEIPGGSVKQSSEGLVAVYPTASELVTKVANHLGLTPNINFEDFTPDNLSGDNLITYADLVSSIFSWTSRLPQRQINIFIRGDTLHCIQRGKELSVFDISNLPHSRPTFNRKFNRVLCHNPASSNDDDDDDDKIKFSGTIYYSTADMYLAYHYNDGLLIKEESTFRSDTLERQSFTTYNYSSIDGDFYLSQKKATSISIDKAEDPDSVNKKITATNKKVSNTTFHYKSTLNDIFLFYEQEKISDSDELYADEFDSVIEIRETYHVPVGNGWYAQILYVDGVRQGGNLSQGKPGNKVSPYTVDHFQNSIVNEITLPVKKSDDELSTIVDYSFPVRESDLKKSLNNDLRRLHRKIVESGSLDLISPVIKGIPQINHIVDFSERILLDGNEYFLVSNKIFFTSHKFIQKLQLIRWY